MATQKLLAYVDESGSNVLDTTDRKESNLFICVAVLVKEANKKICKEGLEEISNRLNSGAEIKSSKIGKNHNLRMNFLEGVVTLPFQYSAIVINKDYIYKDSGLRYKSSFYKYTNSMLYCNLIRITDNLHVFADQYGSKEFMESFANYFKTKGYPDLFYSFDHHFLDSKKERLLQLADIIAGTLAHSYDEQKKSKHTSKYRQLLKQKELHIEVWPPGVWQSLYKDPSCENFQGLDFRDFLIQQAVDFIHEHHEDMEDIVQMRVCSLKQLLMTSLEDIESPRSIYSNAMIKQLQKCGFTDLNEQLFKMQIIGRIRDSGVIITGSNEGYRLALNEQDIAEYVRRVQQTVEPMLKRLEIARDLMKQHSQAKYDILSQQEFYILKQIMDIYKEVRLEIATKRQD